MPPANDMTMAPGRRSDIVAGAVAALVWAVQEPIDVRVFRFGSSDVAILGKAVVRGRLWRPAGLALHVANGALGGLVFNTVSKRIGGSRRRNALVFALAEHAATYPLTILVDRFHPAGGEPGVPPMARSGRAFAQSTWRHLLYGLVLGSLSRNSSPATRF